MIVFQSTWAIAVGLIVGSSDPANTCDPFRSWLGVQSGSALGTAVCGVGDLNQDGTPDLAIAEPGFDSVLGANVGRIRVRSGSDNASIRLWTGVVAGAGFGNAVASIGDINGDGVPDVGVGAWLESNSSVHRAGGVYLYSGSSGQLLFHLQGTFQDGRFGSAIAGVGDINGDGRDDIAVGAPGPNIPDWPQMGEVRLYSGATGQLLKTIVSPEHADRFGISMATIPDIDRDAIDELLIGAPWASGAAGLGCGKAHIVSIASGTPHYVLEGASPQSSFGWSVARLAGSISTDSAEFVVAAMTASNKHVFSCGMVYGFKGKSNKPLWVASGFEEYEFFGSSSAAGGDVDGDDVRDAIIGAYGSTGTNGPLSGRVYVLSGLNGEIIRHFEGEGPAAAFGLAVGLAGDVNHDGFDDVIAGAPWADNGASDGGTAHLLLGSPRGDVTCDQRVNVADLVTVISYWGDCKGELLACVGDITRNGNVDIHDLLLVIIDWTL